MAFRIMMMLVVACVATKAYAGESLSRVRQEVRQPESSSGGSADDDDDHDHHHHHHDCHIEDRSGICQAMAEQFAVMITAPFWGPPVMIGDDYSKIGGFPEYPYKHGHGGWMQIEPCYAPRPGKPFMVRTRGEYANTFEGVERVGGQFLFDHTSRFGLDTEFNYWAEHRGTQIADELWTGDLNVVFRFAQSERIQMRTGLGMNWLNDNIGTETGFNFTYALDYFPIDPLVCTAELDWGELGDAKLVHVRSTIGVHYHRFEVYTGFDHFKIGDVELNSLVAGVRLWL